jgi:hypothetical protein
MNLSKYKLCIWLTVLLSSCDGGNNKNLEPVNNNNNDTKFVVKYYDDFLIKSLFFYTSDSLLTKVIEFDSSMIFDFKKYRHTENGPSLNEWITINKNEKSSINFLNCFIDESLFLEGKVKLIGEHHSTFNYDSKFVYLVNSSKLISKKNLSNNRFEMEFSFSDISYDTGIYLKLICQNVLPDSTITFTSIYKHYVLNKDPEFKVVEKKPIVLNPNVQQIFDSTLIDDLGRVPD